MNYLRPNLSYVVLNLLYSDALKLEVQFYDSKNRHHEV